MTEIHKIFGLPGTGKTTYLRDLLLDLIDNHNVAPDEILFSSFSRSSSAAIFKSLESYGYDQETLPYFRTLHSLSFKVLGINPKESLVSAIDRKAFTTKNAVDYVPTDTDKNLPPLEEIDKFGLVAWQKEPKDAGGVFFTWWQRLLKKYIYDKQIKNAIKRREQLSEDELAAVRSYPIDRQIKLYDAWREYKEDNYLFEFDDAILKVVLDGVPFYDIGYMIIDEAQDISPLQFKLITLWMQDADKAYFAYDPNQCIYFFNQADPALLESLSTPNELILNHSYRVPRLPWGYARAFAHMIGNHTIDKVSATDKEGDVRHLEYDAVFDVLLQDPDKPTYLLFRTNLSRIQFTKACYEHNIVPTGFPQNKPPMAASSSPFRAFYQVLLSLYAGKPIPKKAALTALAAIPASFYVQRGLKTKLLERNELSASLKGRLSVDEVVTTEFLTLLDSQYRTIEAFKDLIQSAKVKAAGKEILITTSPASNPILSEVQIGTIFSAKGLEAERVFLFDYIPHKDAKISRDELRIIFVGITRTSDELFFVDMPDQSVLGSKRKRPLIADLLENGSNSRWL